MRRRGGFHGIIALPERGYKGDVEMKLIWKRNPNLSYPALDSNRGKPVRVEPVRMDEDGRLVFKEQDESETDSDRRPPHASGFGALLAE